MFIHIGTFTCHPIEVFLDKCIVCWLSVHRLLAVNLDVKNWPQLYPGIQTSLSWRRSFLSRWRSVFHPGPLGSSPVGRAQNITLQLLWHHCKWLFRFYSCKCFFRLSSQPNNFFTALVCTMAPLLFWVSCMENQWLRLINVCLQTDYMKKVWWVLSLEVVCMLQYSLRTPGSRQFNNHKKIELWTSF